MPKESKLTPRQEAFCREYLKDLNGTQAALRAGIGGTDKSAGVAATRMLADPRIKCVIQANMDKRAKRVEIDADDVLRRINELASTDMAGCFDENCRLKSIHDIPEELRRCIKSVKVFEEFEGFGKDRVKVGEVREVTFWDKVKALQLLGQHKVLFTQRVEHSGLDQLAEKLARARARREGKKK